MVLFFEKAWEKGWYIFPCQVGRSIEEENEIYKIGRRGIPGEQTRTNARGGESFHNYLLAVDVAFSTSQFHLGGGSPWASTWPWQQLGELAESLGLGWGGRFKTQRGDLGHFEMSFGFNVHELYAFYQNGGLPNVWLQLDKKRSL